MAKVFIIQDAGRLDFSDAERFGDLEPILKRDVYPDDIDERLPMMRRILIAKLANFTPNDYLLLTGDPIAIVLATVTLFKTFGFTLVNMLKWDNENRKYYEIPIRETEV